MSLPNIRKLYLSPKVRIIVADQEIHIITNREQTPENEAVIANELDELGIHYHHLVVTAKKAEYILKTGITVYFDDTDEYFLDLPESVTVFKIREPWNFDFENHKWLYNDKNPILKYKQDVIQNPC